jgi:hypothetical protein
MDEEQGLGDQVEERHPTHLESVDHHRIHVLDLSSIGQSGGEGMKI